MGRYNTYFCFRKAFALFFPRPLSRTHARVKPFLWYCMVREGAPVSEVRKIAAILVADVVGYSRLAGADEDRSLSAAGLPVVVVNPAQVRAFAKALGKRAKTDPIDAAVIAHFVEAAKPDIRPMPDEKTRLLPNLVARRAQIVQMIVADRQRQKRLIEKRLLKSIAVYSPRCRRSSPASRPTSMRRCAA